MDIHYSELPFKISFKNWNGKNGCDTKYSDYSYIQEYTDNLLEAKVQNVNIHELVETWVKFESVGNEKSNDAALYIDGIDSLLPNNIKYDKDDKPYIGINTEVPLYIQEGKNRSYPWIPGNYIIRVIWNKKEYYTIISVQPKNMDEKSLETMRNELERLVLGLAREFIRKKRGIDIEKYSNIYTPILLDKTLLIQSEFNRIMFYLNEIIKKANYEVVKQYSIKPFHKVTKIDTKSNRWLQSEKSIFVNSGYLNKPSYLLAPYTVLCYDTQVNRWIKYIVVFIKEILRKSIDEIAKIKQYYIDEIEEINKFSNEMNDVKGSYINNRKKILNDLLNLDQEVLNMIYELDLILDKLSNLNIGKLKVRTIPLLLTREYKYNYIYKLYRKLNEKLELSLEKFYEFQWKSTDLLYEYWCYLKVVQSLKEIGYNPIKGWIYDLDDTNEFYVPNIKDGTTVYMESNNNRIRVIFNKEIAYHEEEARKLNEPLYSRSVKNKPDIRIDIYDLDNKFIKTIILDAKYRTSKYVWDNEKAKTHCRNDTMNQLDEYATKFYDINDFGRNVTERVIALCPTVLKNKEDFIEYDQHFITLVHLKPGEVSNNLNHMLKKYIDTIINSK